MFVSTKYVLYMIRTNILKHSDRLIYNFSTAMLEWRKARLLQYINNDKNFMIARRRLKKLLLLLLLLLSTVFKRCVSTYSCKLCSIISNLYSNVFIVVRNKLWLRLDIVYEFYIYINLHNTVIVIIIIEISRIFYET